MIDRPSYGPDHTRVRTRATMPPVIRALVLAPLLTIAVSVSTLYAQKQAPLALFVFAHADASGFIDRETTARQKLARDMSKKLRGKDDLFRLVDTADEAEATLEVTEIVSSEPQNNAFWIGLAGVGNIIHSRRAILTVGTYRTGFAARELTAASGLAQLVIDWAKMNRRQLERRAGSAP